MKSKRRNDPEPADLMFQRMSDAFVEYYAATGDPPHELITATGERAAVYAYLYKLGLTKVAENIRAGMHLEKR